MTGDLKHALGILLLILGTIWLFFCLIWMPPVTTAVVWLEIVMRLNSGIPTRFVLYSEFVLSLSAIGAGLYINLRRLMPEKIKAS